MASTWRRAMLYLGLGPDDEYDEYETASPAAAPAEVPARESSAVTTRPATSSVTARPAAPAKAKPATSRPAPPPAADEGPRPAPAKAKPAPPPPVAAARPAPPKAKPAPPKPAPPAAAPPPKKASPARAKAKAAPPPPARSRPAPPPPELDETRAAPPPPEPKQPRPVVRPVPANIKPHVVTPGHFNNAQEIADRFKANQPVIVNLQGADRELARRVIDFSSGLCYGLGGHMEKVANQVYLLSPANVEVSAEERRRALERGLVDA
ncbi:MAG: cell division protein SepF [Acidimicrobiales bacterium]